jgi:hypothetical protein
VEAGKIKNIIIIILAALNLSFLAVIVLDLNETRYAEIREKTELVSFFDANGIYIDADVIPGEVTAGNFYLTRDLSQEKNIINVLLGQAEPQDQGGNIFYYENENGSAFFRNNGEFEINFAHLDDTEGAQKTAASLLKKINISYDDTDSYTEEHGDSRSISMLCTWQNVPIANCRLTLTIFAGGSAQLAGKRPVGTPQRMGDCDMLGINTMLIRFLDEIKSGGYVCDRIEDVDLCYIMRSFPSEASLEPVWQIVTNGGTYRVSVGSGELLND